MKKIIILASCSLLAFAGAAYAGGGCSYGEHAKASPVVEGENLTDPKLLAQLKKKEAETLAKNAIQPVHN